MASSAATKTDNNPRYYVILVKVSKEAMAESVEALDFARTKYRYCTFLRPHPATGERIIMIHAATLSCHHLARAFANRFPPMKMYSVRYDRGNRQQLKFPEDKDPVVVKTLVDTMEEWKGEASAQPIQLANVVVAAAMRQGRADQLFRRDPPSPEASPPAQRIRLNVEIETTTAGRRTIEPPQHAAPVRAHNPQFHIVGLSAGMATPLKKLFINNASTKTAPVRGLSIRLVPKSEHNANTLSILSDLLQKAQNLAGGNHRFYAAVPAWQKLHEGNGKMGDEDDRWIQSHKHRWLAGDPRKIQNFQAFAAAFSEHKGILDMHGFNLYARIKHRAKGHSDTTGKSPRAHERRHLIIALLEAVDAVCDPSPRGLQDIDPSLRFTVRMFGLQEWVYLLGEVCVERFSATFSPIGLATSCHEQVDAWYEAKAGDDQLAIATKGASKAIFDAFSKRKQMKSDDCALAAAGVRPIGPMLPEDAARLDCIGLAAPPTQGVYTAADLGGGDWVQLAFTWTHLTADPRVRAIKTEPGTTRIEYARLEEGPAPPTHLEALNPASMVKGDLSMVITGKAESSDDGPIPPAPEVDAIHDAWNQGVTFANLYFRGVIVTSAAYKTKDIDEVSIRLTFAHRAHLFIAWATLPKWIALLGLVNPVAHATVDTWGHLHPLASLGADVVQVSNSVNTIQMAFAHPLNIMAPAIVRVVEFERERQKVQVTYSNALDALSRVHASVVLAHSSGSYASGRGEYATTLKPFFAFDHISMCKRCGVLGHTEASCTNVRVALTQECPACSSSETISHERGEYCSLRESFVQNTEKLLQRTLERITIDGIWAKEHAAFAKTALAIV